MDLIVTLNTGSSSVKFSVYANAAEPVLRLEGQVENLGPQARLILNSKPPQTTNLGAVDHEGALTEILKAVAAELGQGQVAGVGHRIVHGGTEFVAPCVLDEDVLGRLSALNDLAPLHQPFNLAMVDTAQSIFPDAVQVGCFDTAFHHGHPWVNDTFALPRQFYDEGVRRYGFHGLSYEYITGTLKKQYPDLYKSRVVVAHLGNGASMCAIRGGRSIGSTMGFSALDGLPMGTRCGQVDPGVILYLIRKGFSEPEITHILYKESGLKGLSGITHDMRTLLASEVPEAAMAIDYYVFRIRRELGAMAAVLGGLDALVFCGGVGEHASEIRARVVDGMSFLGLSLDVGANAENARDIGAGPVEILVIPTDEELVLARAVSKQLRKRNSV